MLCKEGFAFQVVALLPIVAALGYAVRHFIIRRIGETESTITMTFYI